MLNYALTTYVMVLNRYVAMWSAAPGDKLHSPSKLIGAYDYDDARCVYVYATLSDTYKYRQTATTLSRHHRIIITTNYPLHIQPPIYNRINMSFSAPHPTTLRCHGM